MSKEIYVDASMEIVEFDCEDVIATSNELVEDDLG
jgi:hypothetical protein